MKKAVLAAALCLVSCRGGPRERVEAELRAPPGASWGSARLVSFYERSEGGGGHGWGPSTFDQAELALEIDGESVALDGVSELAGFFRSTRVREIVGGDFVLALSKEAAWVLVSRDGGESWTAVEPRSRFTCEHLLLRGPVEAVARIAHAPREVVLDVLASRSAEAGPLGLRHEGRRGHGFWSRRNVRGELESAGLWALAHDSEGDGALRSAAVEALLAVPDNYIEEVVAPLQTIAARAARSDPAVAARLRAVLGGLRPGRVAPAARAAQALDEAELPDAQLAVANHLLLQASRPPAELDEELAKNGGEFTFTRLGWQLAKLCHRDGAVLPESMRAAAAMLRALERRLPAEGEAAGREASDRQADPWGFTHASVEGFATYLAQMLGMSGSNEAVAVLDGLRWQREAEPAQWTLRFADPRRDYRTGPYETARVSGWLRAARNAAVASSSPKEPQR